MSTALATPMAKKKQATAGGYRAVKLSDEAYDVVKKVANFRGVTMADYLSEIVLPVAIKDLKAEARKIAGPDR